MFRFISVQYKSFIWVRYVPVPILICNVFPYELFLFLYNVHPSFIWVRYVPVPIHLCNVFPHELFNPDFSTLRLSEIMGSSSWKAHLWSWLQSVHLTTFLGLSVNHYSGRLQWLILTSQHHASIFCWPVLSNQSIKDFFKIMFPRDLISGFFLLSEVFIGFMGNSLLFILYMYAFLIQPHLKKPIDMIFTHLTLIKILSIVFRLIPDVMASFAVKLLFHDVGCKAVLYAYSVTRGLSICTTSLLSAFQAITVSPNHSKWAWLKSKLESCIFPSLLFIWLINTFLYIPMVENIKGQINLTVVDSRYPQTYFQSNQVCHHTTMSLVTALMIRDILFVFLMIRTSLYMVTLLFTHNRRTIGACPQLQWLFPGLFWKESHTQHPSACRLLHVFLFLKHLCYLLFSSQT